MTLYALKPYLYWGGVLIALLCEQRFSYRPPTVSRPRRWLANLPLSMVNGTVYHLLYTGPIMGLLALVQGQGLGLLNLVALPAWLKVVLGILILDFFIYLWHLLTHALPVLWRLHQVHHCDLNMDVTTANRFHIGEFLATGLIRLAVIYTFGIPLLAYVFFEILVNLAVQFHHSSLRLPPGFERAWALLLVPPSLHRIHHSTRVPEQNSNYGVILSLWDRLCGTFRDDVDQEAIVIGINAQRDPERLGLWSLMLMPFRRNQ